jgi:TusA-related sulfurtransferase
MESDRKLDLRGVVEPWCFLQCKSTIASMGPGSILEICLRDSETLKDLMTILKRSGELIMGSETKKDHFRLWVRKSQVLGAEGPLNKTDCSQRRKEKKDVQRGS